jgi:crossover junction endodeoxyribonuclease RuvC
MAKNIHNEPEDMASRKDSRCLSRSGCRRTWPKIDQLSHRNSKGPRNQLRNILILLSNVLSYAFKISLRLQQNSRIILGIDPGTVIMGYGIIRVQGRQIELVKMDVLKLGAKKDMFERLRLIAETISELIREHAPHEVAIEAPFFGKNVQSMLKLGRAQGVAIAVSMQSGLPVAEYSPRKIKQSITGNGNADKEKVWMMLQQLMPLKDPLKYFDASDALAVALCHHFSKGALPRTKTSKKKKDAGWSAYLKNNPERVLG